MGSDTKSSKTSNQNNMSFLKKNTVFNKPYFLKADYISREEYTDARQTTKTNSTI